MSRATPTSYHHSRSASRHSTPSQSREQRKRFASLLLNSPTPLPPHLIIELSNELNLEEKEIDAFLEYIREEWEGGWYRVKLWENERVLDLRLSSNKHEVLATLGGLLTLFLPRKHMFERKVLSTGRGRCHNLGKSAKEPDVSYRARGLQSGELSRKPTLVIEYTYAGSDSDLEVAAIAGRWGCPNGELDLDDNMDHTNAILVFSIKDESSSHPRIRIRLFVRTGLLPYLSSDFSVIAAYDSYDIALVDDFEWRVDEHDPNDIERSLKVPAFLFYRQIDHLLLDKSSISPVGTLEDSQNGIDSRINLEIASTILHLHGVTVAQIEN